MPTASYLIADVQLKLGDPSGNVYSSDTLLKWLNAAQRDFALRQLTPRQLDATDCTRGQTRFPINPDTVMIETIASRLKIPKVLKRISPSEYYQQVAACPGAVAQDPDVWTEMDKNIYIYPAYGQDAPSTALPFDIGPFDATIQVFTTNGFPRVGRIRIDDEEIEYSDTDASHFLFCSRGVADTPAESHDGNLVTGTAASVVLCPLYKVYRKFPPDLTVFDESEIRGAYHELLELYMMYLAYQQTGESDKSDAMYKKYEQAMDMVQWSNSKEDLTTIGVHDLQTQSRSNLYGQR